MLKDQFECIFATRFVNKYIIEEIEKSCSSYIKLKEGHNEHFDEFLTFINKEDIVVLDNYFFTTYYPDIILLDRTYAKKPGFYSKSLFLTHKYLRETGFFSLPA